MQKTINKKSGQVPGVLLSLSTKKLVFEVIPNLSH